jgi:uncharacterized protein YbjQ (UPF0145 family)
MKATTTTTYDETKYEVIGIVESTTTRAISEFRQFFAKLLGSFGGQSDLLNAKFMKARDDAIDALKQKAERMGADLLVGVSLTTNVVNMGGTEFLTYAGLGTALRRKSGIPVEAGGKRRRTFRKKTV